MARSDDSRHPRFARVALFVVQRAHLSSLRRLLPYFRRLLPIDSGVLLHIPLPVGFLLVFVFLEFISTTERD